MLEKYSPKHFLLLLSLSAEAFWLGVLWHNLIYGLFISLFGWGFWGQGDEPVFFIIAIFVVPVGFILGAIGKMWEQCVARPVGGMITRGIPIPDGWRYVAPGGNYVWLWRFSKGIEAETGGRIRAAGTFCAVFFLGIVGLVIIRLIIQRRLSRVAT